MMHGIDVEAHVMENYLNRRDNTMQNLNVYYPTIVVVLKSQNIQS